MLQGLEFFSSGEQAGRLELIDRDSGFSCVRCKRSGGSFKRWTGAFNNDLLNGRQRGWNDQNRESEIDKQKGDNKNC